LRTAEWIFLQLLRGKISSTKHDVEMSGKTQKNMEDPFPFWGFWAKFMVNL